MSEVIETHRLHFSDGIAEVALDINGMVSVNVWDEAYRDLLFSMDAPNFDDLIDAYHRMLESE